MYHIPEDKRSRTSAQMIADGLKRIVVKRKFSHISVSELCLEAGVSRPTFYRLFDTPNDIIHWVCTTETQLLAKDFQQNQVLSGFTPFQYLLQYIYNHPGALELAIMADRQDIADEAFLCQMRPIFEDIRLQDQLTTVEYTMAGVITSAIIASAFREWMRTGRRVTAEELHETVIKILRAIQ